jgi:hypothetical protein
VTRTLDLDNLLGNRYEHATFHDAVLESLHVSYAEQSASLVFKIPAGVECGDLRYQAGVLSFGGLQFMVVEPPDQPYSYCEPAGAWITSDGAFPDPKMRSSFKIPKPLPDDGFVHYFFASDWNAFIFIGATEASFTGEIESQHVAAAQLGAAPDFEPRVAVSQVRYHFACGSKPVSFERWAVEQTIWNSTSYLRR